VTVDTRRFEYALEPVLQRRRWLFEAARAELGRVQRELADGERVLDELERRLRAETERCVLSAARGLNLTAHPATLRWLASWRSEVERARAKLAELREAHARAREACREKERDVETIARHREEELADFARGEAAREATEADRDWLMRRRIGDGS